MKGQEKGKGEERTLWLRLEGKEQIDIKEFDRFMGEDTRMLLPLRMFGRGRLALACPVGEKIPLRQRLKQEMSEKQILSLLSQMKDMVWFCRSRGLDYRKILWDPQYLYLKEENFRLFGIYLPGTVKNTGFGQWLSLFLDMAVWDICESHRRLAPIEEYVRQSRHLSLVELNELLEAAGENGSREILWEQSPPTQAL